MNRKKTITLGDKIFARVTRNGRTIFNYVTEKVATMSQLISELRIAMKDVQGLVMIHIRNYHQGWGDERPLMLYAQKVNDYEVAGRNSGGRSAGLSDSQEVSNSRMLFPWETH
ncbi:MAG: hypothetical protein J1F43_07640 [Muribaculaceae bacterium]|nr:hypothetical protein [Muribaculaceae bacterium]